jgi:GNAT superfamily N-acetyltransferase
VDGLDAALSVDWLERALRDGTIADPSQDLIIAEVFGEVVGFGLVTGTAGDESGQTYYLAGKVLPEWRGEGIGRALITENERRLTSHAGQNGERWPCVFETACADTQDDAVELLISLGYIPVATGPFSVGKPGLIPPAVGDKQILFRKAMR